MKKILVIDRDGTLISEATDFQIDSFEKLAFLPGVMNYLGKIAREMDFTLVMFTNQDGLGSRTFPENTFWPVQDFVIKTLEGEGIVFSEVIIDRTIVGDVAMTRKPNTKLLEAYIHQAYDLVESYVIGDRITDVQLAKNLGAKAILLVDGKVVVEDNLPVALRCNTWGEIYNFLKAPDRIYSRRRRTQETDVFVEVNLDGTGQSAITTGIAFFDHMLEQIARHSGIDLKIEAKGDLKVDEHHTVEDSAIALGEVFLEALGNRKGIERYGFCLPMDDCLAQVALDLGGRNWIVWNAEFKREKIGEMATELFFHFFKSFSDAGKCNLNISAEGQNEHHKIEAIFKGFAKALKMALKRDIQNMGVPSTKGVL